MRAITQNLLFNIKPKPSAKNTKITSFINNIMSESNQDLTFNKARLVVKKVLAKPQSEGDGAIVRRGIGR